MASKVEIANLALGIIGEEPITSFSDDDKAARTVNLWYDPVRRSLLRNHPWNFAVKRAALAQLTETPAFGYDHQYALPSDFLRLLNLNDEDKEYEIEAGNLLSDADSVSIRYIYNATDPNDFDTLFYMAFAAALAIPIAMPITNDKEQVQLAQNIFDKRMADARSVDGMENGPDQIEADEWLNARFGATRNELLPIKEV